jgi:hypothetical protein
MAVAESGLPSKVHLIVIDGLDEARYNRRAE